ncbi:iron dicitrate transport regulator FecR [Pantoea rodasii]|uniref:Iron dicitrate transport regulator FecR n=1 Tax=Pantoea rodasii TaxID=1076549 RepID=A0A2M9W5Y2_9GAMM|nr:ferric citrate uptake sigma factor regulator FecR [Pantoea rodasii]ORM65332.1 iron dicitrate transport regulator FecR [Pantoea rodasii]PJZ02957.1 iron dicitrate transport regulator FecR [Pantoea rodasii]
MSVSLSTEQRQALRNASHWYAVLSGERVSPQQEEKWQQWVEANHENQWAWQQVENLRQQMHTMPGNVASKALHDSQLTRRNVLKGLLLAVGAGTSWQLWHSDSATGLRADYHTVKGEIRQFPLSDGSLLTLDTASAANVRFGDNERRIDLLFGKLAITSGKDTLQRPLRVYTPQGQLTALGTEFSVEQQIDRTLLRVNQHAVAVRLAQQPDKLMTVHQGQMLSFTADAFASLENITGRMEWTRGLLSVSDRPLGEVIAQLARYRQGVLRCDPQVSQLRVSGTFPLLQSDVALNALQQTLPISLQRVTRYWVTVKAR